MTVRIYGAFDGTGKPLGFYPDDIWPPEGQNLAPKEGEAPPPYTRNTGIPAEAVEISQADWIALLRNPWWTYVDGAVVQNPSPAPAPKSESQNPFVELTALMQKLDARLTALEKRK
jgi:hypothetical protein